MSELSWAIERTSLVDITLYVARKDGFVYSITIFEGVIKAFMDIEGINLPSLSRRTASLSEAKDVCQQWSNSLAVLMKK